MTTQVVRSLTAAPYLPCTNSGTAVIPTRTAEDHAAKPSE
jgi:hypothetical protein